MGFIPLLLVVLLGITNIARAENEEYVPGNPGAEWSIEEMLAVKHVLHQILRDPETALEDVPEGPHGSLDQTFTGKEIYDRYNIELGDQDLQTALLPDVPKLVRLAFHDCVPDDETGGCNGYEMVDALMHLLLSIENTFLTVKIGA